MPQYRTPGVYINEVSSLPATISCLPSHIPVFIGYTQSCGSAAGSLLNQPTRVISLLEFEDYFGGDALHKFAITELKRARVSDVSHGGKTYSLQQNTPNYLLYRSISWYFYNGGGACYIVSVGTYDKPINTTALLAGLAAVANEDEPSLVVIPDVVALDTLAECSLVQQAVVSLCAQNKIKRFAILDIYQGFNARNQSGQSDCIEGFRNSIVGRHLSYAAAYYPWLNSLIVSNKQLSFANIANIDSLKMFLTIELDQLYPRLNRQTLAKHKQIKALISDIKNVQSTSLSQEQQAACQQLNSSLQACSPLYTQIMQSIMQKLNRLPPSAAICGAYGQNDIDSGVWKAPANIALLAVSSPCVDINNSEQQDLNVTSSGKSVNALRTFSGKGTLIWGARTLAGNDNEWRYVNIRRSALMIEQSITSGMEAMVFEPNEHNLWVKIKVMCDNFLQQLWREGALAGTKPEHAYFVKVGLGQTMTEVDVREGRLIVQIGIAMTKPAEFIVVTIKQNMSPA